MNFKQYLNESVFSVKLNWKGEIHEFNIEAKSERDALMKATYGLSKKLGKIRKAVEREFNGSKDNYEIHKVS